jgi:anti-sigma regulatory factor (Ser/Thr protein kinase)
VPHEIVDVGAATEKPQQLVNDALQEQLLGGDRRKPLTKIEPKLRPKSVQRPGPGSVGLGLAVVADVAQKVEIRLH